MTARSALLTLALPALLVTGCEAASEPDPSPTPSSAPTTSQTATEALAEPSPAGPEPSPTAPEPSPAPSGEATGSALLTDVRMAHQEGFDRVTFEFAGVLPRYDVRYSDGPVLASGSGDEVEVGGDAVLMVRLEPASGYDIAAATPSYDGPERLTGDTTNVVEVVRVSDFEAVLEWAIGMRATSSYEVTTLDDPARVVLDVTAD